MHGQRETSLLPRFACTLAHALFLSAAGWVCFGGGGEAVSGLISDAPAVAGDLSRRIVLFSCGVVLFFRMSVTLFGLLKRRFGWNELGGVLFALLVYQLGFALLGWAETASLGFLDAFAIVLFLSGSGLNTGAEWQRKRFKEKPENQGRLFTDGLFRFARHINYFGDTLWVTGWAILTRSIWALIIPAALTAAFIFVFIPSLSRYLGSRYGDQYEAWTRNTKAFIPFVY